MKIPHWQGISQLEATFHQAGINIPRADLWEIDEAFNDIQKRRLDKDLRRYRKYLDRVDMKPISSIPDGGIPEGQHLKAIDGKLYMFSNRIKSNGVTGRHMPEKRNELLLFRTKQVEKIITSHFQNPKRWIGYVKFILIGETPNLSISTDNNRYINLEVRADWIDLNKYSTDKYLIARKLAVLEEGLIQVEVWDKVEIRKLGYGGTAKKHIAFLAYNNYAHTIAGTISGARAGLNTKQFNKVRNELS